MPNGEDSKITKHMKQGASVRSVYIAVSLGILIASGLSAVVVKALTIQSSIAGVAQDCATAAVKQHNSYTEAHPTIQNEVGLLEQQVATAHSAITGLQMVDVRREEQMTRVVEKLDWIIARLGSDGAP